MLALLLSEPTDEEDQENTYVYLPGWMYEPFVNLPNQNKLPVKPPVTRALRPTSWSGMGYVFSRLWMAGLKVRAEAWIQGAAEPR